MAIEHGPGGTMITGPHIELYGLCVLLSGMKLEAKGLKMSRGRSCMAITKARFGFKGNRAKVIAQLEAHIARMEAEINGGA